MRRPKNSIWSAISKNRKKGTARKSRSKQLLSNKRHALGENNKWRWLPFLKGFKEIGMSNWSIDKLIRKDWFRGTKIYSLIYSISRIWRLEELTNSLDLLLELDRPKRRNTLRVNYSTIQMKRGCQWASNNPKETRIRVERVTVERVWVMAAITQWARRVTDLSEQQAIFKMSLQTQINL